MNHKSPKKYGDGRCMDFYDFSYRQHLGSLSFVSLSHPSICHLTTAKLCRLSNLCGNDSSIWRLDVHLNQL